MKIITVTGPVTEPVTTAELREQASLLDDSTHDVLLTRLGKAARSSIEAMAGCRMMPQTVRIELDAFPSGDIDLGIYPISAITAVAYDDADGVAQTLTANVGYWADLGGMYPRLSPVDSWPATRSGKPGCVRITASAGWSTAADVPEDIRAAVLARASELFDQRAETSAAPLSPVSVGVGLLVAPWRRGGV